MPRRIGRKWGSVRRDESDTKKAVKRRVHSSGGEGVEQLKKHENCSKKIVTGDSHPVPDGSTKPAHSRLTTRV